MLVFCACFLLCLVFLCCGPGRVEEREWLCAEVCWLILFVCIFVFFVVCLCSACVSDGVPSQVGLSRRESGCV